MYAGIDNLVVSAGKVSAEIDYELTPRIARMCAVSENQVLSYRILKRSIDARKKPDVKLLYKLVVELKDTARPVLPAVRENPVPEVSSFEPVNRSGIRSPVIVGAGPAGLFAALTLAMAGAKPVVIERGFSVEQRRKDIRAFLDTRQLNTDSNYLFGEGGAGTWSDGKLFTRVRSEVMPFVMNTFVQCGAPENILYVSHPHLGSDRLPQIIAALRQKIIDYGGSFLWGKQVIAPVMKNGKCSGVRLSTGESVEAAAVLMAPGHSARELILNLIAAGASFRLKGFQTGMRIEHRQSFINRMQYGREESFPAVGAADYCLSCSPGRGSDVTSGATTFCMCPGGEIIPAVCEHGLLCTNGMSLYARTGKFANSAVITTVDATAFSSAEEVFSFLERMEKAAFRIGGGDYTAPAQTASDFLAGKSGSLPAESSYCFGRVPADMNKIFPSAVSSVLQKALCRFDRMMPGFIREGTFTGVETHVSSPVRFERDVQRLDTPGCPRLYIAGEGAGMAGGITSAAIDGIRLATAMLECD